MCEPFGRPASTRITEQVLQRRCARILEHVGMLPEDAGYVAESLVLAELRGVRSHGVIRLRAYVERIKRGALNPRAALHVVRDSKAVAVLDACDGHGIPAGVRAMNLCIEKAHEYGIGAVAVRRSNHFGMAWYFVKRAVEKSMIGVAVSNGDALVAPWGARHRFLGTNPLAIGIPAGEEPPISVDMATSVAAHGRILLAQERNQPIPMGWALDRDGNPTNDPVAALQGALLPFGGAKGSALSLVIDLVSGPLAGALSSAFIGPGFDRPQGLGHLFLVINVAKFIDPSEFKRRVDETIRLIRSLPPARGFDRVYVPGEPEWLAEQENRRHGIALDAVAMRDLQSLERDLGITDQGSEGVSAGNA